MTIMEKRVVLGVQKTKVHTKRTKKHIKIKHFVKKLVDYLKCDSYLFAPLISRSLKNVEMNVEEKGESEKFVKRVKNYLKSDSYMYASLVVAPTKSFYVPPKEVPARSQIERVTAVELMRSSITFRDRSQLANGIAKASQLAMDYLPKKVINNRRPQVQKETVKRTVYQKYRQSQKECFA